MPAAPGAQSSERPPHPIGWFRRFIFAPSRRTAVLAGMLALAVGLVFVMLQRQEPAAWRQDTAGAGISVMTFNVLLGGKPASDALDAIGLAQPDIVCLQEMTPDLATQFIARFGKRYPHRYFKPGRMTQGIGIASRFPLSDGKVLSLGLTFLPAVSATAQLDTGGVRLACVHLMPPFARFRKSVNVWKRYFRNEEIRIGQVERLLDHLAASPIPAIVMGDMNEWPGAPSLSRMAAEGFVNACRGPDARCGPTYPGRLINLPAMFHVDHIMGRGIAFSGAAVLEAGGSDHYPIVARFRVRRDAGGVASSE